MRTCKSCKQEKPLEDFPKVSKPAQYTEGRGHTCKKCRYLKRKDYLKNYFSQHPEKLKESYLRHRERKIKEAKARYLKMSPEQKQKYIESAKKRYAIKKHDPEFRKILKQRNSLQKKKPINRICRSLGRRLAGALAGQIFKQIRCTGKEFQESIESKFLPNMSWDNYGEWHIDHIKPISSFDLSIPEQIREVNHPSNLQPLWAKDNVAKSNKKL